MVKEHPFKIPVQYYKPSKTTSKSTDVLFTDVISLQTNISHALSAFSVFLHDPPKYLTAVWNNSWEFFQITNLFKS